MTTASRLLVVRHGHTPWNNVRFLGRADIPLDEVGRAQATTIADLLHHEPVDRVFCSPLRRAVATAEPLARRLGLEVVVHPELSELDCGSWQGTLKAGPERKLSKRDPCVPLPGGESLSDAWRRMDRFRSSVQLDDLPGCTVVVGHYLTDQLLVGMLLDVPLTQSLRSPLYRPAPGSVVELRHEHGRWRLHAFRLTALGAAL